MIKVDDKMHIFLQDFKELKLLLFPTVIKIKKNYNKNSTVFP
jgi:hypothetical protein